MYIDIAIVSLWFGVHVLTWNDLTYAWNYAYDAYNNATLIHLSSDTNIMVNQHYRYDLRTINHILNTDLYSTEDWWHSYAVVKWSSFELMAGHLSSANPLPKHMGIVNMTTASAT